MKEFSFKIISTIERARLLLRGASHRTISYNNLVDLLLVLLLLALYSIIVSTRFTMVCHIEPFSCTDFM